MASTQVYATIAELKLRIERTRATDDVILLAILTAASRSIDNACNRIKDGFVAAVSSAREFTGSGRTVQRIDECASVSLVEVKDSIGDATYTAWAGTDWDLFSGDPRTPGFNVGPFNKLMTAYLGNYLTFTGGVTAGSGNDPAFLSGAAGHGVFNPRSVYGIPTVRVTAFWGYALTCPPEIREAAVMQASRWYKRYQSAMTDTLATGETGTLIYEKSLDPAIKRILVDGRYVRRTVS